MYFFFLIKYFCDKKFIGRDHTKIVIIYPVVLYIITVLKLVSILLRFKRSYWLFFHILFLQVMLFKKQLISFFASLRGNLKKKWKISISSVHFVTSITDWLILWVLICALIPDKYRNPHYLRFLCNYMLDYHSQR